jgi:hypothetical protein
MSTYFKAWGTTMGTCPDPSFWTPENAPVVGRFCNGKPVTQGLAAGVLEWTALTPNEFADIWGRWNTNKNTAGSFDIPDRAGAAATSFRGVTAWAEEPSSRWGQTIRQNVTMRIVITA